MTDSVAILQWTTRLLAVGLLVRSVETLMLRREFQPDGLLARSAPWTRHPMIRPLDTLLRPAPLAVSVLVLQAAAAAVSLALPVTDSRVRMAAVVLLITTVVGNLRFVTTRNASDVMYAIGQGGVAAALMDTGDGSLRTMGLLFIAVQVSIAYLAAGVVKLLSPQWRGGEAILTVLAGTRYGHDTAATLVTRFTILRPVFAWTTILIELLLGVAALLPTPALFAVLAAGVLLHLVIASLMRIDSFIWAFTATYPAVYLLHRLVHG